MKHDGIGCLRKLADRRGFQVSSNLPIYTVPISPQSGRMADSLWNLGYEGMIKERILSRTHQISTEVSP